MVQQNPYSPFRIERTGIIGIFVVICVPLVVSENEEIMPEGMAMIVGGGFEMGSRNTPSEQPTHTVHLGALCLDQREVARRTR